MEEDLDIKVRQILASAVAGAALPEGSGDVLAQASRRWPYATVLQILRLVAEPALPEAERRRLQSAIALSVSNPHAIDLLRGAEWLRFYPADPEGEGTPTTSDAISLFLERYGHQSAEEDALLERMIFHPTPDYAEVLAREEQEHLPEAPTDPLSPQGRIDAFILSRHPAAAAEPPEEPEAKEERKPIHRPPRETTSETGLLSESLAAVYIRQRRFERAYEILSALSAKYPHRNPILQPQLSFLRKLIINARAAGNAPAPGGKE